MKNLILRICRWLLPFFGVSAVISCDNVINGPDMYGCPPAEYGVPIVEFSVSGRVVDPDAKPIPNIEVTWGNMYGKAVTAEDGTFHYENSDIGDLMTEVALTFTDVDGEENGGDFATEQVVVPLTKTEPGDGNWDGGEYSASDVEIVLVKKAE